MASEFSGPRIGILVRDSPWLESRASAVAKNDVDF